MAEFRDTAPLIMHLISNDITFRKKGMFSLQSLYGSSNEVKVILNTVSCPLTQSVNWGSFNFITKFQKIYCYSTTTLLERHINFHQADRDITKCFSKALKIMIVQQKNHIITIMQVFFSKVRGDLNFPKMGKGHLPWG